MIRRNIKLMKLSQLFYGMWPLAALMMVYFETITNSYTIATAVTSLALFIQAVLEIPTGILSDKIGRRKTLLSSYFFFISGSFLWAFASVHNQINWLFYGSFLYGISMALLSGTDRALIYETMEELGEEQNFDKLFSKSWMFRFMGYTFGSLLAAIVTYYYPIKILAWLSVIPLIAAMGVTWFYVEPTRPKETKIINPLKHFKEAFTLIFKNKKLRVYLMMSMFAEGFALTMRRFDNVYFATLIPLWLVSITRTLKQLSGTIGFLFASTFKRFGYLKVYFTCYFSNTAIRLIGLLLNNPLTPFLMSILNLFFGVSETAKTDLLQHEFSKQQRATMASIISLCSALFSILFMFAIGFLADMFSVWIALMSAVMIRFALGVLFVLLLKKQKVIQ